MVIRLPRELAELLPRHRAQPIDGAEKILAIVYACDDVQATVRVTEGEELHIPDEPFRLFAKMRATLCSA